MSGLAEIKPDDGARRGMARGLARRLAFVLVLAGADWMCSGAELQDVFANRETITAASGQISANNVTASVEAGEPKHGGKTGGHSMWISWAAPANGAVRMKTEGSGFDTLLSAYYFGSTGDTTFDKLVEAARADDSEGFGRESEIEFGVIAGQRYEIAVDGYFGGVGAVEFKWELETTEFAPPVVLETPGDRSARLGEAVTLTVVLTNAGPSRFKWFFNGNELDATTTNLSITSMQVTNVGRYKLRIDVENVRFFTIPTELQINTDGETNALAQGKLLDSPGTPLIGQDGGGAALLKAGPASLKPLDDTGGGSGVVRGYNGSQIFNTTFATIDPAEPPHCGVANGVSYWLVYQPPSNGTITLDTVGSTYDTVMEVYTYDGGLTGFQDLISLDCNDDTPGLGGASRVVVPVVRTRQYVVAVEGVQGSRGTAWLNYSLNTNQLPQPPTLLSQPALRVAASGEEVVLGPSVTGSAPMRFSWTKNSIPLTGQSGPVLVLPEVTPNDSADYVVTVTNDVGGLTATLPLRVVLPTQSVLAPVADGMLLSFPTVSGQLYTVEEADRVTGPWQSWPNAYFGDGQAVAANIPVAGTKFYRVRIE